MSELCSDGQVFGCFLQCFQTGFRLIFVDLKRITVRVYVGFSGKFSVVLLGGFFMVF